MNNRPKRSFKEKMIAFMYGRNGPDALYSFIIWFGLTLIIINLFIGSIILSLLYFALVGYAIFRLMSRNVQKRRKENAAYLKIQNKFTSFFKLRHSKFKDRKTHVYKKCPSCKKVLRFPKRKGDHTVVCPCCQARFNVKIK